MSRAFLYYTTIPCVQAFEVHQSSSQLSMAPTLSQGLKVTPTREEANAARPETGWRQASYCSCIGTTASEQATRQQETRHTGH
jgi:hypothetical protein